MGDFNDCCVPPKPDKCPPPPKHDCLPPCPPCRRPNYCCCEPRCDNDGIGGIGILILLVVLYCLFCGNNEKGGLFGGLF